MARLGEKLLNIFIIIFAGVSLVFIIKHMPELITDCKNVSAELFTMLSLANGIVSKIFFGTILALQVALSAILILWSIVYLFITFVAHSTDLFNQ